MKLWERSDTSGRKREPVIEMAAVRVRSTRGGNQ